MRLEDPQRADQDPGSGLLGDRSAAAAAGGQRPLLQRLLEPDDMPEASAAG